MRRFAVIFISLAALGLLAACGSETPAKSRKHSEAPQLTSNVQYCAQNRDPKCPTGSYHGTNVALAPTSGYWDADGNPVNGGPMGANGSKRSNLSQEYCARNKSAGCPVGSYVGPNAIRNPDGSPGYVVCEGSICTNPNYGGADSGGFWDVNGNPIHGGPMGANGSTGNNHTQEYCARTEDPSCPVGSFVSADAIKNPDGSPGYVVCEGTICTNPNYGGEDPPFDDSCEGTICTNPNHGGNDSPNGPASESDPADDSPVPDVDVPDDVPAPGDMDDPEDPSFDDPVPDDGDSDGTTPADDSDSGDVSVDDE